MQTELHKLVLAEVLAQLVVNRVIDCEMVGGEELGKAQGRSLSGREILCVGGPFQRADGVLVKPVVDGALIPHSDAASALVEKRDAQSYQFEKSRRQGSTGAQRNIQGAKRLGHCRKPADYCGNAEVDPISLTQILCRHRREGRGRRDSCQFIVSYVILAGSSEVSPLGATRYSPLLTFRRRKIVTVTEYQWLQPDSLAFLQHLQPRSGSSR